MLLSSLIVQRQVASMRHVEEALARQVIYGGDLASNLLEVARVDETALTEALAASVGLPPAPAGRLPPPPESVRCLVPAELAAQHLFMPLETRGDELVLAVAEPLSANVKDQIAFALGMRLVELAATSVRVREAIGHAYGTPLDRRVQRLLTRLGGGGGAEHSPVTARLPVTAPPPIGGQPPATARLPALVQPVGAAQMPSATPLGPPVHLPSTAAPIGTGKTIAGAASRAPAAPRHSTIKGLPLEVAASPPSEIRAPVGVTIYTGGNPGSAASPPERKPELIERHVPATSLRPGQRRRGPLTFDTFRKEASEASDRDTLLSLAFDFARQFFEYTALFLVHGDIAEGRDGFGSGATRERVRGIGVPLDMPSVLSRARESRIPVVTKGRSQGLDAVLFGDLNRPRDVEVAVIPLVVRTRAVAILLGDCGDSDIDRAAMRQVVEGLGVVSKAFEQMIVRRKTQSVGGGSRSVLPAQAPTGRIATMRFQTVSPHDSWAPDHTPPLPSLAPTPQPSPTPPPMEPIAKEVTIGTARATRAIGGPPIPREEPDEQASPAPIADYLGRDHHSTQAHSASDDHGFETVSVRDLIPPHSFAVSVAPHAPPTGRVAPTPLPSIIVDSDEELESIIDRIVAGQGDEAMEFALSRQEDRVLSALIRRFPGPVTFHRSAIASMTPPPPPSACGPILRLLAQARRSALPLVLERLESPDPEIRGWATHLLCELPYLEALPGLRARLRDADPATRASAVFALAAMKKTFGDNAVEALVRHEAATGPEEQAAAFRAMGEAQQPALAPVLLRGLVSEHEQVRTAAHDALVQLARQDFGSDAQAWTPWWESNQGRHRIEWLIDALVHPTVDIRRAAGNELRAQSRQYFGYTSDLPPRDRERAQQRYRDWWITEGRSRHSRP